LVAIGDVWARSAGPQRPGQVDIGLREQLGVVELGFVGEHVGVGVARFVPALVLFLAWTLAARVYFVRQSSREPARVKVEATAAAKSRPTAGRAALTRYLARSRPERAANLDVIGRETEMGKWLMGGTAAACTALAAVGASAAMASTHAGGVTIKVADKGQTYVINKSATDTMYFSPATASVKSGQTLTFTYEGTPQDEPHTISVVAKKDLPTTNAEINACSNGGDKVCNSIIAGHIKNPKAPPGPTNDIVHWTIDKGKPGLDGPGDSIAIEGAKHKTISIKVTAPAGTTLYFFCVVHPWMHGELKVT
jgi:plastocyanin